jgi:hypothetical protein
VIVLILVASGAMALAWPFRKKGRDPFGADVSGPGSAISGGHCHSDGDSCSGGDGD